MSEWKPISAVGGKALLRKLEQHTVEVATAALDESLSNGWQGVFPVLGIKPLKEKEEDKK